MSQRIKLLFVIVVSALALLIGYLYKYQQLVNEGSYLADEHCIKVNPLIIARKNDYRDEMKLMMASASAEDVQNALSKYAKASNAYQDEEKKWLEKQRKYLDGKIFKLVIPSYVREGAEFQYQMYQPEYNSSLYLSQAFVENDQTKQEELFRKVVDETAKSKDAGDKYNVAWERNKGRSDWQNNFIKVPQSKCPAENFNIPDVPNPFIPKIPSGNDHIAG